LLAVMVPIALVLSAGSDYVVGVLLGLKWTAAGPLIAILTLSVMLSPFSYTSSVVLTATGKLKANFTVVTLASACKLMFLYAAAQTGNLHVVAAASLTITSIESSLFIFMLRRNGSRMRGSFWPLCRIIASAIVTALAMDATGLAWVGADILPFTASVIRGTALGVLGFGVYAAALAGLWNAAGRPDGPERRIINVLLPLLARIWRRALALLARRRLDAA
jgi:lipopolysaccharide exporter